MSKDLKTLKGKIEVPHYSETILISRDVNLTVFDGGELRGKSLQIGFKNPMHEPVHIQLDNDTVKELIEILQENFIDS